MQAEKISIWRMCREVSSSSLSNLFSIPGTHSYQILSLPTICQSFPFYHFLLIWKIQVFCVCVWEIKSLMFFFFLKEFLLFFRINLPCKTKQYSCSSKGITYPLYGNTDYTLGLHTQLESDPSGQCLRPMGSMGLSILFFFPETLAFTNRPSIYMTWRIWLNIRMSFL